MGRLTWKEHAAIFWVCIDRALDATRPLDFNGKQILVPDWDTRMKQQELSANSALPMNPPERC